MFYKPEIRKSIRSRRKNMEKTAINLASKQIAAQLIYLPPLIESQNIAFYYPTEGEVDPRPIIECEEYQQKNFYLPVIDPNLKTLSFYSYLREEKLNANSLGIEEPNFKNKKPISFPELDIILVPLVAFDKYCNRIGRGGGFYDRTFASLKDLEKHTRPILIGLAYEFQKIELIVPSDWDVPMDLIVTENEIYTRH